MKNQEVITASGAIPGLVVPCAPVVRNGRSGIVVEHTSDGAYAVLCSDATLDRGPDLRASGWDLAVQHPVGRLLAAVWWYQRWVCDEGADDPNDLATYTAYEHVLGGSDTLEDLRVLTQGIAALAAGLDSADEEEDG